jgi:hypothetical protein
MARSAKPQSVSPSPCGPVVGLSPWWPRPYAAEWVEQVFHPVPSPTNRVHALAQGGPLHGSAAPWRVARTELYLSWTQLSWIARAVHCNAGRPELWVLFPGD